MGLVKVRFEVVNEVQFSRAFETLATQVSDLSKPYEEITNEFYESMSNVFSAEGAFENRSKWADLSPAYQAWKQKRYPGRKILELTGTLLASIAVRGAFGNVTKVSPTEMVVGTSIPYAIYHQTGTPRMPARKIIELTEDQKKRWVQIIHKFLYGLTQTAANATRKTL